MQQKAWSIAGFCVGVMLAFWVAFASGCWSKVKSPLTDKPVPIEQAYEDYEIKAKQESAKQQAEEKAAKAQADAEIAAQKAEVARVEREAKRREAEAKRKYDEQVAKAVATLEDVTIASDADLEAALLSLDLNTRAKLEAIRKDLESATAQRVEWLAQRKAEIQAVEAENAKRWAAVAGIWDAVSPVVASVVPGGAAATGGINGLLALIAGGSGIAALRERNRRTKSETEKESTAVALAQAELERAEIERKAKVLSESAVSIVDSIDQIKNMPDGQKLWESVKGQVAKWQSPDAVKVVTAAQTHRDPLEAV